MLYKNTSKLCIGGNFWIFSVFENAIFEKIGNFGMLSLEIFFKWTEKWTEKFIFKFVNWTKFFFKRVNFELNSVHFLARWTRTELSSHFWWTVTSLSEGVHQKVKSLLSNLESLHYKNCTVGRWKQTLYLFHYVKYNHLPHSLAPPPSFWSELRSILISEFVEMFPWFCIQRRKVSIYDSLWH